MWNIDINELRQANDGDNADTKKVMSQPAAPRISRGLAYKKPNAKTPRRAIFCRRGSLIFERIGRGSAIMTRSEAIWSAELNQYMLPGWQ